MPAPYVQEPQLSVLALNTPAHRALELSRATTNVSPLAFCDELGSPANTPPPLYNVAVPCRVRRMLLFVSRNTAVGVRPGPAVVMFTVNPLDQADCTEVCVAHRAMAFTWWVPAELQLCEALIPPTASQPELLPSPQSK